MKLHPESVAAIVDQLAEAVIEPVAQRVAEIHRGEPSVGAPLMTAADVAQRFGVSAEWVRDHAQELGVIRIGDVGPGRRPRLRFDPRRVEETFAARISREEVRRSPADEAPAPDRVTARRRRRPTAPSVQLLPIRGRDA